MRVAVKGGISKVQIKSKAKKQRQERKGEFCGLRGFSHFLPIQKGK